MSKKNFFFLLVSFSLVYTDARAQTMEDFHDKARFVIEASSLAIEKCELCLSGLMDSCEYVKKLSDIGIKSSTEAIEIAEALNSAGSFKPTIETALLMEKVSSHTKRLSSCSARAKILAEIDK
ncbi:MAG: hypothetical protein ACO3L1_00225 [Flavobacteriaceae bacterium]